MKLLAWNEEKNKWLKENRGISFEEVAVSINTGDIIAQIEHPNKSRYSNQHFYIVKLKGYVYVIPFIEDLNKRFLKTAYPSRKYKKYLQEGKL